MNNEDTPSKSGKDKDKDGNGKETRKARVEVRGMEIDDLAGVFHLGEALFTSEALPNLYRTWDEYGVIDLYKSDPELCLVAELEESSQLVGFVLGTTIEKNRSSWKYGYLQWLGVDPSLKGLGIGTKLVHEFRSIISKTGARMLLVDTEADNYDALQFFKRQGFVNPQQHIYLSLNLASRRQEAQAKAKAKRTTKKKPAGRSGGGKP